LVIGVKGAKDIENTKLGVIAKNGSAAQKWRVVYADGKGEPNKVAPNKGAPKKGGLDNPPYGIKAGEVFYLRSRLPIQRVLDINDDTSRY